jgi:type 1 glutamine amidotransferase
METLTPLNYNPMILRGIKQLTIFLLLFLVSCFTPKDTSAQRQFKALLFTKTAGFHHESINEGVDAIRKLGERHFFTVEWQENASVFNEKKLSEFQVVIFLNTTGDILNDEQQKAFEKFIQSGKGFVGIHAAADTEYDWAWYTQMVGRMFKIHPTIQTAVLRVQDAKFPGMERLPAAWYWTDEWYQYGEEKTKGMNYILTVDEKTYNPNVKWGDNEGKGMGDFHPIAWYHNYDGGRSFYSGLGHMPLIYSDPVFLDHLYGGIYWAATGKK